MEPDMTMITRRCPACGHVGQDVHEQPTYIGGRGEVFALHCDNWPECSQRQDENDRVEATSCDP